MIDTSAFVKTLEGKPIAVFGLGLSGLSTAKALVAGGAKVSAWDDSEEKRMAAEREGVPLLNFMTTGLAGYSALVLAPGIPLHYPEPHPAALRAREAGIEIIGDLEILHRSLHGAHTIGITGTNGKSTTTALIAHILYQAGINAMAGGNIGWPVLDLPPPQKNSVIVLEISSYQMDLCSTYRPHISVLLNITPDHLDRHGGLEQYAAAKERIFEGEGIGVGGIDTPLSAAAYDRAVKTGIRRMIPISLAKEIPGGVYVKNNILFDHTDESPVEIGSVADLSSLPGAHNHENLCAAYAVCRQFGLIPADILAHAKTYPGLPHRQNIVRVINGVAYINDSKATNAEAASKAIACYRNIYLIAGGRQKEGGLNGLEPLLDRINHVFLIGESVDDFAGWLKHNGVEHTKSYSLDVAVLEAHNKAQADRGQPGGAGTVLLSPACASWDQFNNFEHRGEVFATLVNSLSEDVS